MIVLIGTALFESSVQITSRCVILCYSSN